MGYCCAGLENLTSCAGERGHAAIVGVDSSGEYQLHLQSRGIAFDELPKLKPMDVDLTINLSAEIGMRFCPFCGRRVVELVRENREQFRKMEMKHRKFLMAIKAQ